MDWITEHIAIGNHIDAHNVALRKRFGFSAVVSLDGSMTAAAAEANGYDDWFITTLIDGAGNSFDLHRKIIHALIDMAEGCPPVLVHCHAGRSRSVAVVAGYLVKTQGMSPKAAFDLLLANVRRKFSRGLKFW